MTIIVTLGVIADAAHKTRVRFTVTAGRPAALAGSRSLRASVPTWGQVLGRNGEKTYVTTYVGPNAHAKPGDFYVCSAQTTYVIFIRIMLRAKPPYCRNSLTIISANSKILIEFPPARMRTLCFPAACMVRLESANHLTTLRCVPRSHVHRTD